MWMKIINIFKEIFGDIGLTLSFLSLVATVLVSFMIYWLQRHHEKEMESLQERQRLKELESQANAFLVDHEDERDYLPWCVFASQLHRHEKHTRKIYTDFCRISDELQQEVLRLASFNIKIVPAEQWSAKVLDLLQKDIEKYKLGSDLGRDILYEGGKLFWRGFERYREKEWNDIDVQAVFKPIYKGPWFNPRECVNCWGYIDQYMCFLQREERLDDILTIELNPVPPIDYVWNGAGLGNADEELVCAWVMTLVHDIASCVPKQNSDAESAQLQDIREIDYTDAVVETYEDKYYQALHMLYNTYLNNFI